MMDNTGVGYYKKLPSFPNLASGFFILLFTRIAYTRMVHYASATNYYFV